MTYTSKNAELSKRSRKITDFELEKRKQELLQDVDRLLDLYVEQEEKRTRFFRKHPWQYIHWRLSPEGRAWQAQKDIARFFCEF